MSDTKIHKLLIIGSGPAGLTAAIYAARAQLQPIVVGGRVFGGQLMLTSEVENFPGFKHGIMGPQLMFDMLEQAKKFGAEVVNKNVTAVEFQTKKQGNLPIHKVLVEGQEFLAHAVIIATGAKPRKLGIPGEEQYWGKGVSSCATCDGAFYKGKTVAVVGGGDSAMEEAMFLTKFATKVYVIHRRSEFRASKIMIDRAKENSQIEFVLDTTIAEVKGGESGKVSGLVLENTVTHKQKDLALDGLFLAIGYIPETELFSKYIDVDAEGYAKPVERTHSKVEGVFIAGDVEDNHYRQAITAAADGCKAALDAERWLASLE